MICRAAAVALLLLAVVPARAHDKWANGDPVPEWVKSSCCSQAHAHHLDESVIHDQSDGIHVDGYSYVIPYEKVLPSPDGSAWLFYSVQPDGTQNQPYCFFRGSKGA